MPEPLLNNFRAQPGFQRERRPRMPEAVEPNGGRPAPSVSLRKRLPTMAGFIMPSTPPRTSRPLPHEDPCSAATEGRRRTRGPVPPNAPRPAQPRRRAHGAWPRDLGAQIRHLTNGSGWRVRQPRTTRGTGGTGVHSCDPRCAPGEFTPGPRRTIFGICPDVWSRRTSTRPWRCGPTGSRAATNRSAVPFPPRWRPSAEGLTSPPTSALARLSFLPDISGRAPSGRHRGSRAEPAVRARDAMAPAARPRARTQGRRRSSRTTPRRAQKTGRQGGRSHGSGPSRDG